jgi:hypothetical protein
MRRSQVTNKEIQICFNCEQIITESLSHSCIKGLTQNINRLREEIKERETDSLDGIKFALYTIDEMEKHYELLGLNYKDELYNPFHDLRNKLRMILGLNKMRKILMVVMLVCSMNVFAVDLSATGQIFDTEEQQLERRLHDLESRQQDLEYDLEMQKLAEGN